MAEKKDVEHMRGIQKTLNRELFPLAETIIQAEIATWDTLEIALQDAGCTVSVGRYLFMNSISEGDTRVSDIAERGGLSMSAVSRLCDRMVRDGLLDKQRNPNDGRSHIFALTKTGQAEYEKARVVVEKECELLFSPYSNEKRAEIFGRLQKYISHARSLRDSGRSSSTSNSRFS